MKIIILYGLLFFIGMGLSQCISAGYYRTETRTQNNVKRVIDGGETEYKFTNGMTIKARYSDRVYTAWLYRWSFLGYKEGYAKYSPQEAQEMFMQLQARFHNISPLVYRVQALIMN